MQEFLKLTTEALTLSLPPPPQFLLGFYHFTSVALSPLGGLSPPPLVYATGTDPKHKHPSKNEPSRTEAVTLQPLRLQRHTNPSATPELFHNCQMLNCIINIAVEICFLHNASTCGLP